jgi:hypothetical protein
LIDETDLSEFASIGAVAWPGAPVRDLSPTLSALALAGSNAAVLTRGTQLGNQPGFFIRANEPAICRIISRDGSLLSVRLSPDAIRTRTPSRA